MSTSERSLVLTKSNTFQRRHREQQNAPPTDTLLALNSRPSLGASLQALPDETSLTTTTATIAATTTTTTTTTTTRTYPIVVQKPFSSFIDALVTAFTAILLTWHILLFSEEGKRNENVEELAQKNDNSLMITTTSNSSVTTSVTNIVKESPSLSSIESLKALLPTDTVPDRGHNSVAGSQLFPHCSSSLDVRHVFHRDNTYHNTERYLLTIPETEEENDESCSNRQSSSCSSSRVSLVKPSTSFTSKSSTNPGWSDFDRPISFCALAADTIHYESRELSSTDLSSNLESKSTLSNRAFPANNSRNPAFPGRNIFSSIFPISRPPISPPFPPVSQDRSGLFSAPPPITTTVGLSTFDIPGLRAIDSDDTNSSSRTTPEISSQTLRNNAVDSTNIYKRSGCCTVNELVNFASQNNMEGAIATITTKTTTSKANNFDGRDCDQNEITVDELLLDVTINEETCSLNSTSISLNHSYDSVLDLSICSNPIDETADMEKVLAKNCESNDSDVMPPLTLLMTGTLSCRTSKDIEQYSVKKPTTISTATTCTTLTTTTSYSHNSGTVAPTTDNNHKLEATLNNAFSASYRGAAPVASLEDLCKGERNSDIPTSRTDETITAANSSRNKLRSNDFEGLPIPPSEPPPLPPKQPFESNSKMSRTTTVEQRDSDMSLPSEINEQRFEPRYRSAKVREIPVHRTSSSIPSSTTTAIDYRSSTTPFGDYHQEEYYRKEVRTRTFITRSTETLSAPPLSRSSPIIVERERYPSIDRYYPSEERTTDYNYKYLRNLEEEERRIKKDQERRQREEEDRRKRAEEERRLWELHEQEYLNRKRREREIKHLELESERLERERLEKQRLERNRAAREEAEMQRRTEWERTERARREHEERELEKWRELEKNRLEQERLEEERYERERLERERVERERERQAREQAERERLEREHLERERIEMERLEIERIERIKRERQEREQYEREKEREEQERLEKERQEQERIAREKQELLRLEEELLETQRREAQVREAERIEEENREARRREQERKEAELIAEMQRKAEERETQRRLSERLEKERLKNLRCEQERLAKEKKEAERKELQRQEEERREKELLEAQKRAAEERERERLEDEIRERERQEEERREAERRDRERREAIRRERERQIEEQLEREKLAAIKNAAQERQAARLAELQRDEQRMALERQANELKERERRETERREAERLEEERRLAELREQEKRNAELRERERQEAAEREVQRRHEDRRSREKLDQIAREIEEKEKMEMEKRRLLMQLTNRERRKDMLTSRETLEKLTKPPYYSRENVAGISYGSRDNLSTCTSSEMTTKVEHQVIERVDRTVWSDDPRFPQNGLLESPETGVTMRERLYNRRLTDDDDFSRLSTRRISRYRSKLEKARKEFLSSDVSCASDAIGERFRQTADDILRPRPDYRGPLSQKFESNESNSKHEPSHQPVLFYKPYVSMGPSPYEQEYNRLFARAEHYWAPYKRRLLQPNLYSRIRGYSTSYLETNLDTGVGDIVSTERQTEETNLDDVHRSRSVMDYNRYSRHDTAESNLTHVRSKSADYVMDKKMREESAPPENELQKFGGKTPNVSDHELRFRKSVEKLHVPDWYRERHTAHTTGQDISYTSTNSERLVSGGPSAYSDTTAFSQTGSHDTVLQAITTYGTFSPQLYGGTTVSSGTSMSYSLPSQMPYSGPQTTQCETSRTRYIASPCHEQDRFSATPAPLPIRSTPTPTLNTNASLVIPYGMFDKYKEEIEEMRRSRTSLHQIGSCDEERKEPEDEYVPDERNFRMTEEGAPITREAASDSVKQLLGYTVTVVPSTWNIPGERNSRVIEVADTFVDSQVATSQIDPSLQRIDGRVTIEEVLDAIFQRTKPSLTPVRETGFSERGTVENGQVRNLGIYIRNSQLMRKLMCNPGDAEFLLEKEPLFVRCARCYCTKALEDARLQYVSCKYCYTYYCSRDCREQNWSKHREGCSFARINTLCKGVIMKVRQDQEAQFFLSKIARDGHSALGRGSVNLRLNSTYTAQNYIANGWRALANFQLKKLLHYYTIAALIAEHKEPSLVALCRQYNPNDKFILSVSIIADIEECPQTPSPEPLQVSLSPSPTSELLSPNAEPSLLPPQQQLPASQEFSSTIPSDGFFSAIPTEV